jgi:hypothetical protein
MLLYRYTTVALVFGLLAAGAGRGDSVPADAKEMLTKADSFVLYSLDPDPRRNPAENGFHGWKVLGKTSVKDAGGRRDLLASLEKAAADSDGSMPDCFNPRHGIRVTRGDKTLDLVICFQCLQVEVYAGDQRGKGFLIKDTPRALFNKVLKDADVPLPKQE